MVGGGGGGSVANCPYEGILNVFKCLWMIPRFQFIYFNLHLYRVLCDCFVCKCFYVLVIL